MRRALGPAVASLALAACQDAASALGPSAAHARVHADRLTSALAWRFGPVQLEPAFAAVRPKLARASLIPSRVFDERGLWSEARGELRTLELGGGLGAGSYHLGIRPGAPAPARPADYRAALRLRRIRDGEYEWSARDELAIGEVPVAGLAAALAAFLSRAESAALPDARAAARDALPRTAAALGRLWTLEELRLAGTPEGAVAVTLAAGMDPAGLATDFPRYARFLRERVSPQSFRAVASDNMGARWWESGARGNRLWLRLRVRGGDLVPLEGPPREMPDRIRVRVDYTLRGGLFGAGFEALEADLALTRAPHEKAFVARFDREPDWKLPFLIEPLLRASLRRPFEGEGASLGCAVRDAPGDPTLLLCDYRLAVKESWIVRWLGGIVGSTVSEFRQEAEAEADRFGGQVLWALHDDLVALLP